MTKFAKLIKSISVFVIIIILAVFVGIYLIKQTFLPVSNDSKTVDFMINKGASVSQIGNNLQKAGLVKSGIAFKFYIQLTNSQNKIQAGEFQLAPNLGLTEIVEKLKKGPTELWVTIPEGTRREEVAIKFATALNKDQKFIDDFMALTEGKEGYLFPDTYLFPKAATVNQIVNKLESTFEAKVKNATREQIIMASLLERETFADSEKPIVAGVLFKRLENDWPLQVDATLQYAKDSSKFKTISSSNKYWEPIYSNDKEIDSPFNTYKNLGLPPAPISNPGLSTIEASINPEESDYWYYIHDNSGKIHFARDLSEHNANIAKYLR
ncbi:MAG: endolytic transglycosylase MltG [Microgenomates group bacterium]